MSKMEFRYAIAELMEYFGLSFESKGYQYIRDAEEYLYDRITGDNPVGEVYKYIAQKTATTALRVERTIRQTIEYEYGSALSSEDFLKNLHIEAIKLVEVNKYVLEYIHII